MTVLDGTHRRQVLQAWSDVAHKLRREGTLIKPLPHFSYHGAECYEMASLERLLRACAAKTRPFTVFAKGLASFHGLDPVVYMPVRLSEELAPLHRAIWSGIGGFATNASDYYRPGRWIPHITVAQGEWTTGTSMTREEARQAQGLLARYGFDWEIPVDNLALVEARGTRLVLLRRFKLARRR